jgi:hypothetical protein
MVPMTRLGNKLFTSVLTLTATASLLAGCGGGSHSSALPQATATQAAAPAYTGPLSDATFTITIPKDPSPSSKLRRPSYVSSSTTKIVFTLNTSSVLNAAQVTSFNASSLGSIPVTLNSATCPGSGPWTCTLTIKLPPGTDNLKISAQDSSSNILSQQIQTFTVTAGTNAAGGNNFSTTLDANVATMIVNGAGSCQTGPVGAAFGSVGTSPVTFTVATTDPAGKSIIGPGLPKLEIQDNTATFQTSSGTINGTGGTVAFTINQAAQTFVLTPSNSTTTNASVNVKEVPANTTGSSDGLGAGFPAVKTFAFSTGVAPPSHNFLAVVEQLTLASGQVDLYNVTLGGNTAGSDTFSAFSPATLAVTASTNEAGVNDVDNPQDLRWDSTGDLLIANGGGAPGDNGNVACVPLGAIATGANSATTVSTNADDPVSLAYDSRNGTLAVANQPASSPKQLAEYVLTGNYTASTNNLTASGFGSFGTGTATEMPSLTAGTFAIALSKGTEEDTAHAGTAGTNKVAIFSPTGVETDITDDVSYTVDNPWGIAWDPADSQLAIANNSSFHKLLSFYSVSGTPALQKSVNTTFKNTLVASSADGHIAVAWVKQFGYMQVQIYANHAGATAPTPVFGPIPYNGTTTSCGSTYIYGNGTTIVNALRWLSNTKLLVAVQSNNSGTPTAKNGFYVYDITNSEVPTGFDDITCSAFVAAPINTGFVHVNNKPLSAAFKP